MKLEDFNALSCATMEAYIIGVSELQDKSDRTLLMGWSKPANTWSQRADELAPATMHHLYVQGGEFYIVRYLESRRFKEDQETWKVHALGTDVSMQELRGLRGIFPERSDVDFCRLLMRRGMEIPFEEFNHPVHRALEARGEPLFGPVYEDAPALKL